MATRQGHPSGVDFDYYSGDPEFDYYHSASKSRHADYDGFTKVIVKTAARSFDEGSQEMLTWLADEDRPGTWYGFFDILSLPERSRLYCFWFSDPNVAFEFKMRWT